MRSIFSLNRETVLNLETLALKFPILFIDGTIYNADSGMNFSCAGLKADCLSIYLVEPTDEQKIGSILFNSYLNESNEEQTFKNGLKIYVDKEIIEDLKDDSYFGLLKIKFTNINSNPPQFYAEMS